MSCRNTSNSSELDDIVLELLKKLKLKRDVNFENGAKGVAKKRIVMGCHEILKYLKGDRIKAVIIARNIDWQEEAKRGVKNFSEVQIRCTSQGIPLISASTKHVIGRVLHKHPYVSAVGIFDLSGYEDYFKQIYELWKTDDDYKMYHLDQDSIFA